MNGIGPHPVTGLTVSAMFVNGAVEGPMRMRNLRDGSSNVFAIGEKIRVDVDADTTRASGALFEKYGAYWVGIAPDTRSASCAMRLEPAPSSFAVNGASVNAFASQHDGGCFFLMGDGHVLFISENADQDMIFGYRPDRRRQRCRWHHCQRRLNFTSVRTERWFKNLHAVAGVAPWIQGATRVTQFPF